MFGIPDFSVAAAFLLIILTTVISTVYGIIMWNRGDASDEEIQTERKWMKEEIELEETVDGGVVS